MATHVQNLEEKGTQNLGPILEKILSVYSGPESSQESNEFYKEIINRCISDVAGVLQTTDKQELKPGGALADIYQKLTTGAGHDAQQVKDMILNNLQGYTKKYVQTPHPTEVLSAEAIMAEEKVVKALFAVPDLFKLNTGSPLHKNLTPDRNEELLNALKALGEAISKPVEESLTINQEMYRGLGFSQRQFDSVPRIAEAAMDAVQVNSRDMEFEELRNFAYLVQARTWSPGDQDSKPDMTVDKLRQGVNINHRAAMDRYYRKLVAMGSNGFDRLDAAAQEKMQKIMYRLLKTSSEAHSTPRVITSGVASDVLKGESPNNSFSASTQVYEPFSTSEFFRKFQSELPQLNNADIEIYKDTDEIIKDLEDLRTNETVRKFTFNKDSRITSIDALIIQVMNCKDSAQSVQIRQNADRHQQVVDSLIDLLPENNKPNTEKLHDENDSSAIEGMLDKFLDGSSPEFSASVVKNVAKKLAAIKADLGKIDFERYAKLQEKAKKEEKLTKEGKLTDEDKLTNEEKKFKSKIDEFLESKDYKFYQVMESLGLAVENPDKIPQYLIAECRSKSDLLEAFFLLKVMEKIRDPENKIKNKVEIVNLVEHPDRVMEDENKKIPAVEMTVGAMNNKWFGAHHIGIKTSENLLTDYSLDKGKRRITVAEAKLQYGLTPKPGDELKEVQGVKTMMGAGSDVTKAGGTAAGAAMGDAMERTREALLDMEKPILLIDYIGCGGGVHRSQPVSTQSETTQGRSMRQAVANYAQKTLDLITRYVRTKLGQVFGNKTAEEKHQIWEDAVKEKTPLVEIMPLAKYISADDRKTLCRLNMSNMAALGANSALWENETKPRTYAMINKYHELYDPEKSKEFAALMSYTAEPFVKLTQYAARPVVRTSAAKVAEVFPPLVNVDKTRAIGFGANLNTAGVCAPLFYGASEYLKGDLSTLKQMYLYDPKAQDTINRMTYGIVMTDMDVAWKYVGFDKAPDEASLKELATTKPSADDRKASAIYCLAKIHLEYNTVASELLKLHQSVIGQAPDTIKNGAEAASAILKTLPMALREQLQISRNNMKGPRNTLANLFNQLTGKVERGEKNAEQTNEEIKRGSEIYEKTIYPNMGTIFECFEHAPRAYTSPQWAKNVEQNYKLGLAA